MKEKATEALAIVSVTGVLPAIAAAGLLALGDALPIPLWAQCIGGLALIGWMLAKAAKLACDCR